MNAPVVVVVSGPPCSGKSRLARRLGRRLGWPVLAKDDFKEMLFDALGTGDSAWSARLSRMAFDLQLSVALEFVRAGGSVVLDGNFTAAAHAGRLDGLAQAGGRLVQVACRAEPGVLAARRAARARNAARHPGHLDPLAAPADAQPDRYGPLSIEPTVIYDTTGDPDTLPDLPVGG